MCDSGLKGSGISSKTKREEIKMNKDQLQGMVKNIGGKIQEEAGKLVGNENQQARGIKKQAEGKVQYHIGNLKQFVKHMKNI
jgi:uncharacterized protein YjbJ (UPF0337 family)